MSSTLLLWILLCSWRLPVGCDTGCSKNALHRISIAAYQVKDLRLKQWKNADWMKGHIFANLKEFMGWKKPLASSKILTTSVVKFKSKLASHKNSRRDWVISVREALNPNPFYLYGNCRLISKTNNLKTTQQWSTQPTQLHHPAVLMHFWQRHQEQVQ